MEGKNSIEISIKNILQTIILIKQNNNASARTYFIIQGKCLTCSKMASYLGNTSWLISPKLMKVLVTVVLNKLCNLHMPSCTSTYLTVCYFLSEILRRPDDGRNRNVDIVYSFFFFKKFTEIPPQTCKILWKNIL